MFNNLLKHTYRVVVDITKQLTLTLKFTYL